jgi:hypothetical protein
MLHAVLRGEKHFLNGKHHNTLITMYACTDWWIMTNLMIGLYFQPFPLLFQMFFQLDGLIKHFMPKLWKHFKANGATHMPSLCCVVLTLFE